MESDFRYAVAIDKGANRPEQIVGFRPQFYMSVVDRTGIISDLAQHQRPIFDCEGRAVLGQGLEIDARPNPQFFQSSALQTTPSEDVLKIGRSFVLIEKRPEEEMSSY